MTFELEVDQTFVGKVRPVLMDIGQVGECVCIAIVGWSGESGFFANVVSRRHMPCIPADLSQAIVNFGSLVVADFIDWCTRGKSLDEWTAPLNGIQLGPWRDVEAFDQDDWQRLSMSLTAFWHDDQILNSTKSPEKQPRSREEGRFLSAVEAEVRKLHPSLVHGFRKPLSMKGKIPAGEIDYVGSHYATCYAAINPKARSIARVQTASAALWRLARARDSFGFAAPSRFELTAWVPQEGMPIYSEKDYLLVREIVAELDEQASREGLNVYPSTSAAIASRRLIDSEISMAPAHS